MKTNGAANNQLNDAVFLRLQRLEEDMGDVVALRRKQSQNDIDLANEIAKSNRSYEQLVAQGVLATTKNYSQLELRVSVLEVKVDHLATKSDLSDLSEKLVNSLVKLEAKLEVDLVKMKYSAWFLGSLCLTAIAGQYGLASFVKTMLTQLVN
jgi:chromosome segregation ATPase